MGKVAAILIISCLVVSCMIMFQPVKADAHENLEIIVPDDFASINDAIQNAIDGDIILIRPGMYSETVVIDKAITLRGEEADNTIINGDNKGTVIQILHDDVTVTGLTILYSETQNKPKTYFIHEVPGSIVGGAWLGGLTNNAGYYIRQSLNYRLAGIHLNQAHNCNIIGNKITDCGQGIWLYNAANNTISGNILDRNDYALEVQISSNNLFVGNTLQNGGGGIWFWNTDYNNEEWLKPLNYTDGVHYVNNRFYQNNFIGNIKALEEQTMTKYVQSVWDDGERGNYWSNYNGSDSNGDGIGDSSYPIRGEYWTGTTNANGVWIDQVCGEDHYPLMEPFDTRSIVYMPPSTPSPTEEQATQIPASPATIEYAVAIVGIIVIAALIAYFKKRK